jgi:fatty-acyl-CoA synthase
MFHVHGWGLPYAATTAGVKQVYPGRYQPELLLNLIKVERVTFSHCVPTILQMLLSAPNSKDYDLSKLKMVIGGAALSKALAKAAMQRGIDIFAGYGMSESGPILTIAQLREHELTGDLDAEAELRTKTGTPVPLVDFRIVDAEMKDVAHDGRTAGEIVVRAPWLTMGYLNNPASSEKLWEGATFTLATSAP